MAAIYQRSLPRIVFFILFYLANSCKPAGSESYQEED